MGAGEPTDRPVETPLLCRIRDSVIGDDQEMVGPFGPRRVTYADYTASGRAIGFVEDFIRPFEHHSNELPWRESIADVVVCPQDSDGHIDLDFLAAELERYADRPL